MTGPGGLKGAPALVEHALRSMMMDVVRGEHRDPAMAPLADRLIHGQDPIHRPLRAQVVAFVEQRCHDLRWRTVHEAWAGEHIEDLLALGFTQRPGGRWTGLLVPGS